MTRAFGPRPTLHPVTPAASRRSRTHRRVPWWLPTSVVLLAVLAVVWPAVRAKRARVTPTCRVSNGTVSYGLTPAQAQNATTIATVGKAMGLADHAVTIALATSLQEARLLNLPYGDRDSLGLFQQRPSQGWGTRAARDHPAHRRGAVLPPPGPGTGVGGPAGHGRRERVQHSAAPSAYAQWEAEARVLAVALTGESGAGLTCHFAAPHHPVTATTTGPALRTALANEVGLPGPGDALDRAGVDGRELARGPRRPVRHRPGQLRRAALDRGDGGVARRSAGRRPRALLTPASPKPSPEDEPRPRTQPCASADRAMTLNTAPTGSVSTAKRPGSMSVGGISTVAPRSVARATAASASVTAK